MAPRDPEIEDLGVAVARHHHIGGLEIAVHDPALMRMVERGGDLRAVACHSIGSKRPGRDRRRQRLAFDKLHDQERMAAGFIHLVELADVRVRKRRRRPGFGHHGRGIAPGRDGFQELQRDFAIETRIMRPIHVASRPSPTGSGFCIDRAAGLGQASSGAGLFHVSAGDRRLF